MTYCSFPRHLLESRSRFAANFHYGARLARMWRSTITKWSISFLRLHLPGENPTLKWMANSLPRPAPSGFMRRLLYHQKPQTGSLLEPLISFILRCRPLSYGLLAIEAKSWCVKRISNGKVLASDKRTVHIPLTEYVYDLVGEIKHAADPTGPTDFPMTTWADPKDADSYSWSRVQTISGLPPSAGSASLASQRIALGCVRLSPALQDG